ncbi:hypothetical protein [Kitasatospora sp. MBT66]|nr:hypothetical protein [Kitasatospora sp. MBT66]
MPADPQTRPAHLRRGPIGLTTTAPEADWTVSSLTGLTELLLGGR